ncbi:hypothetical protein [Marinobacter halodurans]|uniref:hypothetical protein n=1 Tax=Marinobacter halodurans TaxID=2528979 RepID=UPI0013F14FA9|nr:hypothetical protein [Marinobacter halodurans]
MRKRGIGKQRYVLRVACRFCLLLLLIFANAHALVADTYSDRRVSVGLNLFGALLVADREADKKANEDGELPIYVLYADDRLEAEGYAQTLQKKLASIRDHRTRVESVSYNAYLAGETDPPLGIFISQRLTDSELEQLIRSSIDGGVILFSPFEGDVEKGVLGGLSVQASVRPYINQKALEQTGLAIKSFYLRVARIYE